MDRKKTHQVLGYHIISKHQNLPRSIHYTRLPALPNHLSIIPCTTLPLLLLPLLRLLLLLSPQPRIPRLLRTLPPPLLRQIYLTPRLRRNLFPPPLLSLHPVNLSVLIAPPLPSASPGASACISCWNRPSSSLSRLGLLPSRRGRSPS